MTLWSDINFLNPGVTTNFIRILQYYPQFFNQENKIYLIRTAEKQKTCDEIIHFAEQKRLYLQYML